MTDLNRRGLLTGGRAAKAAPAATATLPGTYNIRLEQREYTVGNGVPMGGYGWGEDRRSTGVTPGRPMKMACVVLQSGTDSPIVLVRIDVVSIPRHVYDDIKGKLRVQGLIASYAHLVIAQSHTHHGPMVGTIPDPYVLLGSRDAVAVTNAYTTSFIDQVVNLVRSTVTGARTEVTLGYAEAGAYIAMNREDLIWAPREVPILVARNTTGDKKPYALLFGHACHPVCQARSSTLDTDYCGQAAAKIEQELAVPALFFQGTAGDLVPVVSGDEAAVVSNGNQVADAVVGMVRANSLIPVSGPISARLESIQLPFVVNTGTDEGREELRVKYDGRVRLPPERPSDPEVAAIRHAERMLDLIKDRALPTSMPMTVQRINIGGLSILAMAHEVLSGYHVGTKKDFKSPLWIMAYANHVDCYIPARDRLTSGGYAAGWNNDPRLPGVTTAGISYSLPAPLSPDTEAMVVASIKRLGF
jgi:neutral ceramidase